MKKLASVFTVLIALAGFLMQANPVRGDVVANYRQEIFSIIVDPANAEPVEIEGNSEVTIREMDLKDGTVRQETRVSAHGSGIGLWSGTPYQFNETYTYTSVDPAGLEYRTDLRDIVRHISHGARPNVAITQTGSVIRNADGSYSFDFTYDYDVTGRGS